jgi:hypothetical protein
LPPLHLNTAPFRRVAVSCSDQDNWDNWWHGWFLKKRGSEGVDSLNPARMIVSSLSWEAAPNTGVSRVGFFVLSPLSGSRNGLEYWAQHSMLSAIAL